MRMPLKSLKDERYKGGSVLVLVLIVLSSMLILSAGLAYRTRIEMRLAQANARRTQAHYLALGGIERVKSLLSQQEISPSRIAHICRFTGSAAEEGLFEQLSESEPPEKAILTYNLRDEQGYLNLNSSDPASWANMDCISQECQVSIIDWTDGDENVTPGGAETDYYSRLEPAYISKNSPCIALKELLFIRGVARRFYVGEDLNRNSVLEENERDGQLSAPPDNEDSVLDLGLVDIFTVYGDGKININTTSTRILSALQGLDEEVAVLVLNYRAGADGRFGTEDDMVITSSEDLSKIEGLTELQIELLKQYCCFGSEYFRVFSSAGLNGNFQCCLMATVQFADDQIRVLCLERLL
jgi:type II secretory pathway component PulK